jgi:hypothetical protein
VAARIVECTFILVGIIAMLGVATLQQASAGASEDTVAYTLAAIKDWTFLLGPGWLGLVPGSRDHPRGLRELFLGVYCAIWGFKRDAQILSGSGSTPSVGAPALSGSAG